MGAFEVQVTFDKNHKATGEVFFNEGGGSLLSVFGTDRKYWPQAMISALGLHHDGGFPIQLSLNNRPTKPIPAVNFSKNVASVGEVLNKAQKIYVTPAEFFTTDFRQIFTNTKIKHTSGAEAKRWLSGPNMSYSPQQLNFPLWCATTGPGISRDIILSSISLDLTPQLRSFYLFHVYFTTRQVLFEMGGIHSISVSPSDPTFSQTNNPCDFASYRRICAEFGVDPSSDFRYKRGANHGLGNVFVYVSRAGPVSTGMNYSSDKAKFSDNGGSASDGNLVYFIRNDDGTSKQFEYFVQDFAQGLTQVGLSRLKQSIEAFAYCVLGAQVNTRSSIIGNGGRAKETQSEFPVLLEGAIRSPNISKSIQRYQLAVDEAKARLDFAVSPRCWLMPSRMIINTESTVGYNNQLKQAT